MSYEIETRNRGKVWDCGFYSADTSRVRLGELPAIGIRQFCDYATEALVGAADKTSPSQRQEITKWVQIMNSEVAGLKVRSTEDIFPEFPSLRDIQKKN